jgi:hypothetical protein
VAGTVAAGALGGCAHATTTKNDANQHLVDRALSRAAV